MITLLEFRFHNVNLDFSGCRGRRVIKEIMREIQVIMRQVCLMYVYTDTDVAVPFTWVESDPKLIANPQMVKLHAFDTKIHKVDTLVSDKNDEWDE
uniref:HORMA domain-containing protein n=1 Tax=Brassica campestris TaxID=3711 RepID=M4E8S0_BRACM